MSKKKKKNSRRDKQEFPNLDVSYNLKARRDYLDNRYYINGVKQNGELVMSPLKKEIKQYLNDFNKEYYNASFDSKYNYDKIHICQVDEATIMDIKAQIRDIKLLRKRIFNKSPNTTTDEDRKIANGYNDQIEEMEEFLNKIHPRREVEHANNKRNYDLLNMAKASNEYDLVSWEDLKEETISEEDIDSDYVYFDRKEDKY